jgi:hypothetical protein
MATYGERNIADAIDKAGQQLGFQLRPKQQEVVTLFAAEMYSYPCQLVVARAFITLFYQQPSMLLGLPQLVPS